MTINKYLLLSLICLLSFEISHSQENVLSPRSENKPKDITESKNNPIALGIEGGINYNMYSQKLMWDSDVPNSIFNVFSSGTGLTPYFAILLDIPLNSQFGIQGKIGWESKDFGNEYTGTCDCVMDQSFIVDAPVKIKNNVTGTDYAFSVLLRYNITDALLVTLGPILLIPADNYESEVTQTSLSDCDFYPGTPDATKVVSSKVKIPDVNSRFGLDIGLGYKIDLTNSIYITPQIRYNYIFSGLFSDDSTLDETRNNEYGSPNLTFTDNILHSLKIGVSIWFKF